ncbi:MULTISPECIES: prepilin-type N-terminal cleavage/methylation domain-containing protein [unclassified Pseudomonas]|uniref:prepilin-type N-terminal cleavage/methylation domain-containing protein n=1 Tax=unclassified Pseudomonas TaxID=196821 RepID=UPI0023B91EFD|nr:MULTISPECIES: prepilin-type N-terminal cleavage/methylation domain-containing protein [unclassified Pseudomonas]
MRRQRGFTLLEVTVALGIAALLAVISSQALRQRLAVQQSVQQHQAGLLCARELEARFAVERFWPTGSSAAGVLRQGLVNCHWRLQLQGTGVNRLRRGDLSLFADRDGRASMGQYLVFLVRP